MTFSEIAAESIAEIFYNDVIAVYPSTTAVEPVVGPAFEVTYPAAAARATGVECQIEALVGRRVEEQGGGDVVTGEYGITASPGQLDDVLTGDWVLVTTSGDGYLQDARLVVVRVEGRTNSLDRRLICRWPLAVEGSGAP